MKRIVVVVGLLLLAGTFAFGQKNPKLEATLIQMDKDWTAAELKGDTKAASMFVADDFWETTPQGDFWDKKQYIGDLKASKDMDVADQYVVRFYGNDTAIMTHRGTVTGERNFQYRSTHVWMNRGGKWQIVAHHSSEVAAPAAKPSMAPAADSTRSAAPATAPSMMSKPAKPKN